MKKFTQAAMTILVLLASPSALAENGDADHFEFEVDVGLETRSGIGGGLITLHERGSGPVGEGGYLAFDARMSGDLTLPQPYESLPALNVQGIAGVRHAPLDSGLTRSTELVATYDRDMSFGRAQSGTFGVRHVVGNLRNRFALGGKVGLESPVGEHSPNLVPIAVLRGEAENDACLPAGDRNELCVVLGMAAEVGTQFSVSGRGALQYRRLVNNNGYKSYVYAGPEISGTGSYDSTEGVGARSVGAAGFVIGIKN